jgi:hypothetical protein
VVQVTVKEKQQGVGTKVKRLGRGMDNLSLGLKVVKFRLSSVYPNEGSITCMYNNDVKQPYTGTRITN